MQVRKWIWWNEHDNLVVLLLVEGLHVGPIYAQQEFLLNHTEVPYLFLL